MSHTPSSIAKAQRIIDACEAHPKGALMTTTKKTPAPKTTKTLSRPYRYLTDKELLQLYYDHSISKPQLAELDRRLNHAGRLFGITTLPLSKSIVHPTSTINFITTITDSKGATVGHTVMRLLLKARRRLLKTATKIANLTSIAMPVAKPL
jgi:hypothetical protein